MIRVVFDSIFTLTLTSNIETYINILFSYVRQADGIFPMSDVLLALYTLITVWISIYIIKIILSAFAILPFIGKNIKLPGGTNQTETTSETTHSDGRSSKTITQQRRK